MAERKFFIAGARCPTLLVFILFEKALVRSGDRFLLVADILKVSKEALTMLG